MRFGRALIDSLLLALVLVNASVHAQTILMVTATSTLSSEETARRTQLQSWGFTVTTVVDSDSQATIDAAVALADAVYVPCTIEPWDLLYKLRTAAKGMVTEIPDLDTEFGYATADGYTQSWNTLEGVNNTHSVTSGLASGNVVITTSNQNLALNGNTLATGMQVLGTMNWGQMSLGVIQSGGTLANTYSGNSTASGRRVRLPWGWAISFSSLNSNGLTLLHNALDWAANKELLLHYKLDQSSGTSVTDSSGNGYTGTVTGTATWVSAIRNNGFDFNGSTKIEYNGLLGNPGSFTLACWAQIDASDTAGAEGISLGDYVLLRPHDVSNGVALAHFYYGSGSYRTIAATQSYVGKGWHHFAATFDDATNNFKLYVDGVLVATTSTTSSVSWSGLGTKTRVGMHGNTNTNLDMDGQIDDVRVYGYAMTQAEIAVVYGLVGHYKLNETSGTSVADSSGAGNAGTLTGTASWTTAVKANGHRFNYTNGDDYVTFANSSSLQDIQEDDYSLACWFKPESIPPGTPSSANTAGYGLVTKNGTPMGLAYNHDQKFGFGHIFSDGTYIQAASTNTFAPGSYYHVIAVVKRAAGTATVYVNGQVEASYTFTANKAAYEQGTATWKLGIVSPGAATYKYAADGSLDDARLYNRALTAQEIATLAGIGGYWKLEETSGTIATDSSGAGNNGTFVGSPTLAQSAVYDLGTLYNNATLTEYLSLPRGVLHETSAVSASFWVKTTYTGEQAVLSAANASQANEFLFMFYNSTTIRVHFHGSQLDWTIPSIADGEWHHVVMVSRADTNSTTVYLDNVSMGSKTISAGSTALSVDTGGLIIAQDQDSVGGGFSTTQCLRGTLDELRLYQRALTTAEINSLYGLMGRWNLGEGAGTVAAESTGLASSANISGAIWTSDCSGNTALAFDGVNDSAATASTFDPPNEGAVAFWFRSAGPPPSRKRLWGLNADFEMWQESNGLLSCDVSTDGVQGGFITTTPLYTEDRWYHVVAEYDADTEAYAIYVDGELHKSGTSTWAITNQSAGTLTFGTRTGTTDYFEGAIRDFRVYNRKMTPTEIATQSGMIAHWQLNESSGTLANDLAVADNDATYVGNPTLSAQGTNTTNGTAVELNGTSQYVTAGTSLLNGLAKFTIAAWIRPDSITPDKSFLGQNGLIELGIDSSSSQIDLWTTSGGSLIANYQLALAKWSHIAAVGDGTGLKIYVNGVEVGSGGSATASYGTNAGVFKIGEGVLNASGNYFDGRFDDVRVYSRALCPTEIEALYQGGRPSGIRIIQWVETR
jgi:hypothetical protein